MLHDDSNIGSRAELGRIPVGKSIIVAVLKYYARLKLCRKDNILFHALKSQNALKRNSNNTLTFTEVAELLLEQLNVKFNPESCTDTKASINSFGGKVKRECVKIYINQTVMHIKNMKSDPDNKLVIYSCVKDDYKYEPYLDSPHKLRGSLTRFRLSNHWLPIERGRYTKPKSKRSEHMCPLCRLGIGNELHALFRCSNTELKEFRKYYLNKIFKNNPQCQRLDDVKQLILFMKGQDPKINNYVFEWFNKCNNIYKA